MNELMLFEKGDQVVVSSRIIAERFGKRHQDVLYAIEGRTCTCMGEGGARNAAIEVTSS